MKKLIPLFLALVLAACSAVPKSEFDSNLEKWQKADITSYRFSVFVGCFCAFVENMPLTIEVRDGEVASMTKADGSPVSLDDPDYEYFTRYATIDRLFAELKTALDGAAEEVTVTYDSVHGYPAQVYIDFIKLAADDELSLEVSNFEVLK